MLKQAMRSISRTHHDEREIGSITFAASINKLKEEENADMVYQFNFQLFNVTKIRKDK